MNMPAVALTDWANMYGTLYFWKAAKEYGGGTVEPIYGLEMGVQVSGGGPLPRHLVMLAKDKEGFKNLNTIASLAHTVYGYEDGALRPKIPLEKLLEHKAGLIFLSGGLKGVLNSFLIQDQEKMAQETLEFLLTHIAHEDLYLELQDSGFSPHMRANDQLIEWGKKYGVGMVATADVHYAQAEDAFAQEVWMMVSQKLTLETNPISSHASRNFYLRSPEEMRDTFQHIPEACDNTLKIAERCHVKLGFTDKSGKRIYHLPDFSGSGASQEDLFEKECAEGLEKRFDLLGIKKEEIKAKYLERLAYEVSTIKKMGFAGYYLIVSDFIRWAKSHDIPVGPGRGSGAGSLAAYALDITDLDPIEHGLLFERFLNPERVSLPDFDVDFCQARRAEVIRYVGEKYGKDRVCQIVTFAKEQSKNAIKDVGRVMGLSFGETNRLTKFIPSVQMKPLTIQESLDQVVEFKNLVNADPKIRQVVDTALKLEGALRQAGVHAAGVIIASKPVTEIAPVSRDGDGNLITQYDMKMSEEAGLVKFDFLGLVTLDLMHLACNWIRKRPEPEAKTLTYANIPVHDPRAYEIIAKGDTLGVFQLESSGMQNLCTRIRPDRFADICAINALFRPGPLESGMVDDFINRKHGRAKVEVFFPEMEACLRETYGVIVYQEQVQEIAKAVAGYTLGGADLLRRAMGKKNVREMEQQRAIFVEGSVKNKKLPEKASELFDLIEKFAGYGFNKSHAAAYAQLAVQTAFLKAVYPTEFFTALLTIEKEDTERLSRYINDARVRGLQILPPDVNESMSDFSITGDKNIRFGLTAIKNVGEIAVGAIIEARASGGPFKDLFDFVSRADARRLNKRMLECLIQAGAFDSLNTDYSKSEFRGRYLATVELALEWATKTLAKVEEGQASLFGEGTSENALATPQYKRPETALGERQLLDWEKELLGIYISGSPLDKYSERARIAGAKDVFDMAELAPKAVVTLAVCVSELREVRVKKGRRAGEAMAILKLEDNTGQIEAVSFPDHYKQFQELLKSNSPLLFRGELDFEEDRPKIMCGDIKYNDQLSVENLADIEEKWPRKVRVDVALHKIEGSMSIDFIFGELSKVIKKYHGTVPVQLSIKRQGQFQTLMDLDSSFRIHPVPQALNEISSLLAIPGVLRVTPIH